MSYAPLVLRARDDLRGVARFFAGGLAVFLPAGAAFLPAGAAFLAAVARLPTVLGARFMGALPRASPSHMRKPPGNALVLAPIRQSGGNVWISRALPPPSTTSSGSRAAVSRVMTA